MQTARTDSHERAHDLNRSANELGVPSAYHPTLSYLKQAYVTRYPDEGRFGVIDYGNHRYTTRQLLTWACTNVEESSGE